MANCCVSQEPDAASLSFVHDAVAAAEVLERFCMSVTDAILQSGSPDTLLEAVVPASLVSA